MREHYVLVNATLWAAAILAAAVLQAPHFLCVILLPLLAVLSQRTVGPRACRNRSKLS
ncbi:hypothetical protein HDE76_002546 [Rhodanobacter sp. ANJX3]|jgi:hypothetical protein|uniref:hypothetical protein n=1 Tax=unclassified Rhodanobacter TaxID=2621553 RepID=UPI0015CD8E29|nr:MULTISPECIES: hypothetical protein [unclassified Rhodanobacter]MBB5359317.1 hypothetical protein [Rhodanobacter sp. ANJX3]NYE29931.1 hypothetical protein [Rhodanobacter sp. K2T2]